jgi:hypothetical protein
MLGPEPERALMLPPERAQAQAPVPLHLYMPLPAVEAASLQLSLPPVLPVVLALSEPPFNAIWGWIEYQSLYEPTLIYANLSRVRRRLILQCGATGLFQMCNIYVTST